jgi:hypothetical protein
MPSAAIWAALAAGVIVMVVTPVMVSSPMMV